MESQPGCAAAVRNGLTVKRTIVDTLTTKGCTALAQMYPDLMRAAGLQAAFDQRVLTEIFHNPHVSDSTFSWATFQSGPTTAVASVTLQVRFDAPRLCYAANHSQVTALDGMSTELFAEFPFCFPGAGENDQAARLLVQP